MNGKYIDPLVDFSFKKIFGSEPNKDLLIAFLNEVFRGRKQITDLVYSKNEHPGDTEEIGGAIFDLICTGQDGETFLIEVQRSSQGSLKQRMLYYASRLISDMAPKGKRHVWNYAVSEVYVIVLMDGFTLPESSGKRYLHDICLCNRENGEVFYEGLGFIFLELINFVKTEAELETDLYRWLYVLKNMSGMDKIPLYLRKPIFEKLFNIAEYSNLSKEEKAMYDVELKRKWDRANILAYAREQGREQGLAEGEAKGEAKGKEEVIVNGWKNGITLEQLQAITGWEKEKVTEVLKRSHLL
jgi:predicted transposase/invertase (TIGR01784 family)